MLLKRKISIIAVAILVSSTFSSTVNADTLININLENEYKNRNVIEEYKLETDEDALFDLAKKNTDSRTIDENGNYIYKVTQLKEVSMSKSGEKVNTYSETSFHKIEDPNSAKNRASIIHDGWDNTSSAFIKSTTNYSINGNYIRLTSVSGSVSKLNSGVRVQNLTVNIGCVSPLNLGQKVTKNYGTATSFSYTAPSSWKEVPNMTGNGITASVVGSSMLVELGRSSTSTWTQVFTNNVGFFDNSPM